MPWSCSRRRGHRVRRGAGGAPRARLRARPGLLPGRSARSQGAHWSLPPSRFAPRPDRADRTTEGAPSRSENRGCRDAPVSRMLAVGGRQLRQLPPPAIAASPSPRTLPAKAGRRLSGGPASAPAVSQWTVRELLPTPSRAISVARCPITAACWPCSARPNSSASRREAVDAKQEVSLPPRDSSAAKRPPYTQHGGCPPLVTPFALPCRIRWGFRRICDRMLRRPSQSPFTRLHHGGRSHVSRQRHTGRGHRDGGASPALVKLARGEARQAGRGDRAVQDRRQAGRRASSWSRTERRPRDRRPARDQRARGSHDRGRRQASRIDGRRPARCR